MLIARASLQLALAAGIALVGCSVGNQEVAAPPPAKPGPPAAAPPAAGSRFDDAQGRFAIVPPPGWTVDTSGRYGTAVLFLDPDPVAAERFVANLYVSVRLASSRLDLPSVVAAHRRALSQLFPDHRIITEVPATLSDGTPAHLLSATYTDPDVGSVLRILQILTVRDDMAIDVTATSFEDAWESYEPLFDSSLRSLTVAT